jgi:3-methyladenine DNA glycosylase/8-oxoguanine DNA glycosylase
MDHDDLVSLCDIIVRLADQRLLILQAKCQSDTSEFEEVAKQLRPYRQMASELLQWAKKPAPEPDWAAVEANLKAVGAAPLDLSDQPR